LRKGSAHLVEVTAHHAITRPIVQNAHREAILLKMVSVKNAMWPIVEIVLLILTIVANVSASIPSHKRGNAIYVNLIATSVEMNLPAVVVQPGHISMNLCAILVYPCALAVITETLAQNAPN